MTDEEFDLWIKGFSEDQIDSLRGIRALVLDHTQGLQESINTGKWLTDYIFYSAGSKMIYAMGPKGKSKTTFHMMPYYGSSALQARYGRALSPFLTGKSCIAFRNFGELPKRELIEIIELGTPIFLNH